MARENKVDEGSVRRSLNNKRETVIGNWSVNPRLGAKSQGRGWEDGMQDPAGAKRWLAERRAGATLVGLDVVVELADVCFLCAHV